MKLFNYEINISLRSLRPWSHFRIHKGEGTRHLVFGRLSVYIEDLTSEHYAVCSQCQSSEIGEQGYGDESWTVCDDCGSVEQGYTYLNKIEYDKIS